jgi:hypothetical protein
MASRKKLLDSRIRRTFGWTVGVFFALQIGGGFVIDYALPRIRFRWHIDPVERMSCGKRPDLVYLGSSRSMSSLNASELTHELRERTGQFDFRVVGAPIPGGDFLTMEGLVNEMLRQGVRPRVLMLEVVPQTLMTRVRWYNLHLLRQIQWQDLPEHAIDLWQNGQIGRTFSALFLPLYVHRHDIVEYFWNGLPSTYSDDLFPRDTLTEAEMADWLSPNRPISAEKAARAALGADDIGRDMSPYIIGGGSARALDRILDACERNGITPLFVGIPVSSAHRGHFEPDVAGPYHAHLQRLCDRYGAVFVECHDALPDSLFVDHHHTEAPAHVIFSRYLARRLPLRLWTTPTTSPPIRSVGYTRP